MNALFVPFLNAVRLAGGDLREGFDAYALEAGFPVRTFRSKDGVVELDAQLVSVENADLSPDLFSAPEPPAPAGRASRRGQPRPRRTAPSRSRAGRCAGCPTRGGRGRAPTTPPRRAFRERRRRKTPAACRATRARIPARSSAALVDPANLAPLRGRRRSRGAREGGRRDPRGRRPDQLLCADRLPGRRRSRRGARSAHGVHAPRLAREVPLPLPHAAVRRSRKTATRGRPGARALRPLAQRLRCLVSLATPRAPSAPQTAAASRARSRRTSRRCAYPPSRRRPPGPARAAEEDGGLRERPGREGRARPHPRGAREAGREGALTACVRAGPSRSSPSPSPARSAASRCTPRGSSSGLRSRSPCRSRWSSASPSCGCRPSPSSPCARGRASGARSPRRSCARSSRRSSTARRRRCGAPRSPRVAYAFLFLFARWLWQLNDADVTWAAPGDPELTALAFAFYVLSAAVLAGVGRERGPGPRAL